MSRNGIGTPYTVQEILNAVYDDSSRGLNISGTVSGSLTVTGDLTVNGDFNFGDAATDNFTCNGLLTMADGAKYVATASTLTSGNEMAITATPGSSRTSAVVAVTGAGTNWGANSALISLDCGTDASLIGIKIDSAANGPLIQFSENGTTYWTQSFTSGRMNINLQNDISSGDAFQVGATSGAEITASSGTQGYLKIAPRVNQTSTAGYTGILLDVTETATGSGTKNLLDLQVGSSSKFKVSNNGAFTAADDSTCQGYLSVGAAKAFRNITGSGYPGYYPLETAQTPDASMLVLPPESRNLIIVESGDNTTDLGHAQQTNPTVYIHSANVTNTTQWISFSHNQTNGVIDVGTGSILMNDNVLMGSSKHIETRGGELKLATSGGSVEGNIAAYDSSGNQDYLYAAVGATRTLCLISGANTAKDHDIASAESNPTLKIFSGTDPDTNNTQWLSLAHNTTDAVLDAGLGGIKMLPGTKCDGVVTRQAEVQTTDATQTTVDSITLLDENTYHAKAFVVGVKSDGSQRASYEFDVTVYRTGAGNATIQGTVTSIHSQESDSNWDATFTVNGSDLRVSVTGVAATTVEWTTILTYTNMSN